MTEIFVPILTMTALGFLFSTGLVLAYKKLRVDEDPKVEAVNEILPQANCGACGYSGCRAFAEAIVEDVVNIIGCGEESVSVAIEEIDPKEWKEKVYDPMIRRKMDILYKKPGYSM